MNSLPSKVECTDGENPFCHDHKYFIDILYQEYILSSVNVTKGITLIQYVKAQIPSQMGVAPERTQKLLMGGQTDWIH